MHLNIPISDFAKTLFDDLLEHGATIYFVGGIVRDTLLGRDNKDLDVEVYHLPYDLLVERLSHFGHVRTFGASFAVVHLDELPGYEFALPRRETKIGPKHTDFTVTIAPDLAPQMAAKRRDLTINALMVDYADGTLYDFYHGYEDLQNGIIRAVDPLHFGEDPLRVLRIASFMSRLLFQVEEGTKQLCKQMVQEGLLEALSIERITIEYEKILMGTQPSLGLNFLKEVDGLPPYLQALVTTMQRRDYHPEGSVWNHTMLVIDLCAHVKEHTSDPLSFMWSGLLHDIGKPATTVGGHSYRHDEMGVTVFQKDVHMQLSKKQKQYIRCMIAHHMQLMNMATHHARSITFKRLLKELEGIFPLDDLAWFTRCDKMGRGYIASSQIAMFNDYLDEMIALCGDQAEKPLIDGKTLIEAGFSDHHFYKQLLAEAYDLQLAGYQRDAILRRLKGER